MEQRIIVFIILALSILNANNIINRFRVPIEFKTSIGIGYDSNVLRFSNKQISESDIYVLGANSYIDSPILKSTAKLVYKPILFKNKSFSFFTSLSYNYFINQKNKSYYINNLSTSIKLIPYSSIKIGYRFIPKYYLQNYYDRDSVVRDRLECTFASYKYYMMYSFPIYWIPRTWTKLYIENSYEDYNQNFTEFNLNKLSRQFELNYQSKNKSIIRFAYIYGNAINTTFNSQLSSTYFDRSYNFEKVQVKITFNKKLYKITKFGIQAYLENRFYDLKSIRYSLDNWKIYNDGLLKYWFDLDLYDNVDIKISHQYRWRDAKSQLYGDFEWIEDVKSYNKHEVWIEFSFNLVSDILY
tara:strand:+ start:1661 stop:2725 length:1065 start_codon:yes stop_codon:yes gene_type:complete